MSKQKVFNYNFKNINKKSNFYVNKTNVIAYNGIFNDNNSKIYLKGFPKSGKTTLSNFWLKNNNAIKFYNNFKYIINNRKNVLIENLQNDFDNEKLFHIINHCNSYKLNILITSNFDFIDLKFTLKDLISRLKIFTILKIEQPDDDMLINYLTKLFVEKQFVISSFDIFSFIIKNANRSYFDMYALVQKLDKLSLEKKRQLTIPLIKEIL